MSSESKSKKLSLVAGATAVVFGGAFGVTTSQSVREDIAAKQSFREKLAIVKAAVQSGEAAPFTDKHNWLPNESRDLNVADWQQTWTKAPPTNFGKV
jgi:hypothetical protein